MMRLGGQLRLGLVIVTGALLGGCYDFHLAGPTAPPTDVVPRVVSVTIQYRQPQTCANSPSHCNDPVIFYGSWMRPGNEFSLTPDVNSRIFRGTALVVPVNYPPRDVPYTVRVYDPYLSQTATDGYTGHRLVFGNETLTAFQNPGGPKERALVFVDENGFGRNP